MLGKLLLAVAVFQKLVHTSNFVIMGNSISTFIDFKALITWKIVLQLFHWKLWSSTRTPLPFNSQELLLKGEDLGLCAHTFLLWLPKGRVSIVALGWIVIIHLCFVIRETQILEFILRRWWKHDTLKLLILCLFCGIYKLFAAWIFSKSVIINDPLLNFWWVGLELGDFLVWYLNATRSVRSGSARVLRWRVLTVRYSLVTRRLELIQELFTLSVQVT